MQAKQSDVLETKLVAERSVKAKQFNETILADSETLLDIEATATSSWFSREFIVHFLHDGFKHILVVLLPLNKMFEGIEA